MPTRPEVYRATLILLETPSEIEEECDEAACWMELLVEAGILKHRRIAALLNEADEILSMVIASIKTARK